MARAPKRGAARVKEEPASPLSSGGLDGAVHPRETARPLGQERAEQRFDAALDAGRLHHAWLIRGPLGVGKATLAYRLARRILSPDGSGDLGPEEALLRAGAHPGFFELRPAWDEKKGRAKGAIGVDEARRLQGFLQMRRPDGGWRVALVDAADDLTTEAANALLKTLEEPPERVLFLLVSHAPGRLLSTIRSRCRALDAQTLTHQACVDAARAAAPGLDEVAADRLALLADGAPGAALRLRAFGGWEGYREALAALATAPSIDRARMAALAKRKSGAPVAEALDPPARLLPLALERLARAAALGADAAAGLAEDERRVLGRIAPDAASASAWAAAAIETRRRIETAQALNLDPTRTLIDIAAHLEGQAHAARAAAAR